MHTVTSSELDTVASLSNSVDLTFFGVCGGAFLAFGITMLTVTFSNPLLVSGFVAATMVSGLGTAFFGARARISYKDAQRRLLEIKRGNVRPS